MAPASSDGSKVPFRSRSTSSFRQRHTQPPLLIARGKAGARERHRRAGGIVVHDFRLDFIGVRRIGKGEFNRGISYITEPP